MIISLRGREIDIWGLAGMLAIASIVSFINHYVFVTWSNNYNEVTSTTDQAVEAVASLQGTISAIFWGVGGVLVLIAEYRRQKSWNAVEDGDFDGFKRMRDQRTSAGIKFIFLLGALSWVGASHLHHIEMSMARLVVPAMHGFWAAMVVLYLNDMEDSARGVIRLSNLPRAWRDEVCPPRRLSLRRRVSQEAVT